MTRDDIIKMTREAGFTDSNAHSDIIVRHSSGAWVSVHDQLESFAAMVAAAEREACAKVIESYTDDHWIELGQVECADDIRARINHA